MPDTRVFNIDLETRNDEQRTVEASVSSEDPCERLHGNEVLEHTDDAVDLSKAPLPLLISHNGSDLPVGIVEKLRIIKGKLRGVLRFGNSAKAKDVWTDVKTGIIHSLSIGYRIFESKFVDDETYHVTKWMPLEVSLVSLPADTTVGIGRNYQKHERIHIMPDQNNEIDKLKKEKTRVTELLAYGKEFKCEAEAARAVSDGTSVNDFRDTIMRSLQNVQPVETRGDLGLTTKEVKQFRIVRAINALANPQDQAAQRGAGFEFECSAAFAKQIGKETRGLLIPPDVYKRDLTVDTDTAGGFTVATNLLSLIELLRNKSRVVQAGATVFSGLNGDLSLPKVSAGATAYWLGEGDDTTDSQQTFAQLQLSPKTVGGLTEYTRRLMLQASIDVEAFVRADLAATLATAVDLAALHGTGSGNQPTGLVNTSGIGSVAGGTNGLAPAWSHIVGLETEVATDNADVGQLGYITNAKVRGKLKQVFTNATYGEIPLWTSENKEGEGRLNGYRAFATNQVSSALTKGSSSGICSAIFFGNWADLIIAFWSGIDLLVDPYTNSASGGVRITAFQDLDIGIRHPESFSAMLDALT